VIAGPCWRCEEPGHSYRDCQPPPAETETELQARIAHYMELRIAGRISTARKQAWVKDEWSRFHSLAEKKRERKMNGQTGSDE
jgi:hypothetical protein